MNPYKFLVLSGLTILVAVLLAIAFGIEVAAWIKANEPQRQEIHYPDNMPLSWERIPGTNYIIAPTFENKRDTLRINKVVSVSFTYQILTSEQKKHLHDSLSRD